MEAYQNQDWKKIVRKYSTPDPKRSWGQVLNTLTPYKKWAREHAAHHNTSGDLDKRGQGDVWTITTEEYCEINLFEKNSYHFFRSPFVNFVVGPFLIFQFRFRFKQTGDAREGDTNRWLTNFMLFTIITTLCLTSV